MEFDYTAKRLGSKQPPYGKKVVICGKCGRRGTSGGTYPVKDGRRFQMITHASHLLNVGGVRFNHVDDSCHYETPAPAAPVAPERVDAGVAR